MAGYSHKLKDNGLSITLLLLFVFSLGGQILAGERVYNADRTDHHQPRVTLARYLTTGHLIESVFENWESEFLQMGVFVVLTACLYQRGSAESKDPDQTDENEEEANREESGGTSPPDLKGSLLPRVYEHSLSLALFSMFLVSFVLHGAGGAKAYSEEQIAHGGEPVSMLAYFGTSQFWFQSFQNWQSEFFSIAAIIVLSIYLREKGSPESKTVSSPHSQTGR